MAKSLKEQIVKVDYLLDEMHCSTTYDGRWHPDSGVICLNDLDELWKAIKELREMSDAYVWPEGKDAKE